MSSRSTRCSIWSPFGRALEELLLIEVASCFRPKLIRDLVPADEDQPVHGRSFRVAHPVHPRRRAEIETLEPGKPVLNQALAHLLLRKITGKLGLPARREASQRL